MLDILQYSQQFFRFLSKIEKIRCFELLNQKLDIWNNLSKDRIYNSSNILNGESNF